MNDDQIKDFLNSDRRDLSTPKDEWREIHYKINNKERKSFNRHISSWGLGFAFTAFVIAVSINFLNLSNSISPQEKEQIAEYLFENGTDEEATELYTWID